MAKLHALQLEAVAFPESIAPIGPYKRSAAGQKEVLSRCRINAERARQQKEEADAHKGGRGNKVSTNSGRFRDQSCTSRSYLLRRLARQMPEILGRYERGEFKSVRAAALAAGIIREKTPLEILRSVWAKASEGERETFLSEINEIF